MRSGNQAKADAVKRLYRDHVRSMFNFVEGASRTLYGREIPQILLIHDNLINSLVLDSLLADLEARGYRFVSLTDALSDPAYQRSTEASEGEEVCYYVCWGDRRHNQGRSLRYPWSSEPAWINREFEAIRRSSAKEPAQSMGSTPRP